MTRRYRTALLTAGVTAFAGFALPAVADAAATTLTCKPNYFKRDFFANTGLSGKPRKTDCDDAINQNYRAGTPLSGIAKDNFSIRWTVTRDFGSGGPFAFTAQSQDGIRVYVDGVRKIDVWKNVSTTQKKTLNLTIPKGRHTLRIDFAAWTGNANVTFSYAPRTSATVDKTAPLTPAGIKAAYSATTRKATVNWAKNPEMDLAGYRVYRRLQGTSAYTRVAQTTATSYADTPPPTGQVFYYEARAYDKAGRESAGTADMPVTTIDKTPPAAPFVEMDSCPADQPYAAPELVTTAANQAGITGYEMQRLDPVSHAWTTVYTGSKGAICDTGHRADGSEVTYRGRARDAAGNWSAYSAATTFTTSDLTPPAPVADARVDYRAGVPHLVWSLVSGAASYQVLQYDPATGGYLDALVKGSSTALTDVVPRQRLAVTDTYRYAVRSVDAKGNASAPAEIALSMADRPEPAPPYRLVTSAFRSGVNVQWRAADPWSVSDTAPPSFRILRTDVVTGSTTMDPCTPIVNTHFADGVDPALAAGSRVADGDCTDRSGESETAYTYRIVTLDAYGHASQPSEASAVTTLDTVRPAPVENLTAEQIPLGVRLTWTPPADDDVQGYYVWQGTTDPDTGGTVWTKNCWQGQSLAPTEILCPTVPDGQEHVYRIAATDAQLEYLGPEKFHTSDITVTLPDTRPPGWSGTEVREDQYPDLHVRCGVAFDDIPCGDYTDYRWERWDAAAGAWTVFATGKVDAPASHMDATVNGNRLGLYYYRAVYTDSAGSEKVVRQQAYGIWDSWL
ncbi:PA14 domain-containing protein [Streptomyces beijiangensis]|uniref:PA14 domain-containing protein n=1 Tax=Streptomyces beijiangensis TaxID=163361 RepID=A0A939JGE6_9ACTN|nr:PA14 domain-containing protein [Streptomyces beijiangensis]MBO0513348.1 hypothetical protein [Streptomyces beijiangensis]